MASDFICTVVLIRDRKIGQERIVEAHCRSNKKLFCDGRLIKKDCPHFREEHRTLGRTDELTQPDAFGRVAKSLERPEFSAENNSCTTSLLSDDYERNCLV
jgi:hypothetical protein